MLSKEKVIDFANKYQKELIIGGVATGVVTTLLFVLTRGKSKPQTVPVEEKPLTANNGVNCEEDEEDHQEKRKRATKKPRNQDSNQQIVEVKRKSREEILKDILQTVEVKYIGQTNTLDLSTISAVLEQSIELAEEPYTNLTRNNRLKRREVMRSDQSQYEQFIMDYNEGVEKVLIEAQEEMLQALDIEKEQFEESVLCLMERGLYQQMYMLQAAIRQKIKEKIPPTQEVSMEKTKQVIQFQVKVLKEQPDLFKNIISKLQSNMETANLIPTVLNTMLQDLIYEEFQIEEEDQMKNMTGSQVLNDPDIHDLLMQIEEAMFNLMGSMGLGSGLGDGQMM